MTQPEIAFRSMVLEEFSPLIGQRFVADCQPKAVEITLVEASPLRTNRTDLRPPFILIFYTPPEIFLVDGSYVMRCGKWGPDRIWIGSTIAPPDEKPGQYYQAVFN